MFSRFTSVARRAGRQLSTTAAAGDGSGFLIASGVGLAAFACVVPRTNDSAHDAAPALQADDASRKLLAVLSHADELAKIAKVKATQPDNIAIQKFDFEYFASLDPAQQTRLLKCLKTGWENPDSGLGCYAMSPSDYDEFAPFFDAVCQEYHKASADATHVTDWDASAVGDKGVLDVTKLGLSELSMRVRVGRNLSSFPLPGAMTKEDRIEFEKAILKAFDKLKKDPAYGGTVYSLSPDHGGEANPNLITPEKYAELVKKHVMFKDMAADTYLASAVL